MCVQSMSPVGLSVCYLAVVGEPACEIILQPKHAFRGFHVLTKTTLVESNKSQKCPTVKERGIYEVFVSN